MQLDDELGDMFRCRVKWVGQASRSEATPEAEIRSFPPDSFHFLSPRLRPRASSTSSPWSEIDMVQYSICAGTGQRHPSHPAKLRLHAATLLQPITRQALHLLRRPGRRPTKTNKKTSRRSLQPR